MSERRRPGAGWFATPLIPTLALDAALAEAVTALRERGIEPLLVKGPAVAALLYDRPGERPYGDIDLLVARRDAQAARETLTALGYREPLAAARPGEQAAHASLFTRPPAAIDLHWQLHFLPRDDAWELLGRDAASRRIAGAQVRVPGAAAQALIVTLHAAQHGQANRTAVEDVTRAVDRLDIATWRDAADLARAAGAEPALLAGLRLVPRGAALAQRLGIDAELPLRLRVDAGEVLGLARLSDVREAGGLAARARLVLSAIVPSPALMRVSDERARRGRGGLFLAYAARLLRVARRGPATLLVIARAAVEVNRDCCDSPGGPTWLCKDSRVGTRFGMAPERVGFDSIWPLLMRHRGDASALRRIYESSNIPMVWLDNERTYLHANASSRLYLRRTLRQIQGLHVDDLVPSAAQSTLERKWEEFTANNRVAGTIPIRLPDGPQHPVDYSGLANVLPGAHLFVFMPREWPDDELAHFLAEDADIAPGRLTARERDVLALLARGAEIAAIADALSLSPHTVRTHVRNALGRLGAANRAHAIALALQSGEITGPSGAARP